MKKYGLLVWVSVLWLQFFAPYRLNAAGFLTGFPAGTTPVEIGEKLSKRFLKSPHASKNMINYSEVCTWYGALKFAETVGNSQLQRQLQERFDPLFAEEKHLLPIIGFFRYVNGHYVDFSMFGALPLSLYMQNSDEKYLKLGLYYADYQWNLPDSSNKEMECFYRQGLSWQTRYWIDDMYMITILQTQAFLSTGDHKYIDRAACEVAAYLSTLQQPNGLFYHAPDAPHYWARGNGWVAAGMTELLRCLSPEHPLYSSIMNKYLKMMNELKKCQRKDGLWGQLVDKKEDIWAETSGSAMFAYAFISGIRHGWLEEDEFGAAARKAWLALASHLTEEGDLTEVCIGTGKNKDEKFYYERARKTGDFHGQAPMLWCAYALLETIK